VGEAPQTWEVKLTLSVEATSKEDAEQSVYDNLLSPPFEVLNLHVEKARRG